MKKITQLFFVAAALICCTFINSSVKAQATDHVFHVNTWYMVPGQDSITRAERNAVLKEYHDKVTMKNQFVIHSWMMVHFFSEDSREFVTVTEYASFGDIEKAFDRDSELENQAWPDKKQRMDFMKKMNSYFTYHKDAIYNSLPNLSK